MSNRPGQLGQRIAAEIRAELGRQHQSRRWLAEQIGQNHVTVTRWTNGDGPMSFDALEAICRALNISVADLLLAVERQDAMPTPRPPRRTRGNADVAVEGATDNGPSSGGVNRRYAEEGVLVTAA